MWAVVDVMTDAALIVTGAEELKAAAAISELPKTIKTLKDLYNAIKFAWLVISGSLAVSTRPVDAALSLVDAFKKVSVRIPNGQYKDVHNDNFLDVYLNAHGIASLVGAQTVSVMVMSGDGYLSMWTTNADHSWIVIREQRIVRSQYGSLWQRDPDAGTVVWHDMKRKFPWGGGNDRLIEGQIYIISIYGTDKVFVAEAEIARGWLRVSKFRPEDQVQYWKCTKDSSGRWGFLNIVTHKFLGRDVYQNLACKESEQKGWESLVITALSSGGFRLSAHIDDRVCPTLLASDSEGEYMRVVAESNTAIGLDKV